MWQDVAWWLLGNCWTVFKISTAIKLVLGKIQDQIAIWLGIAIGIIISKKIQSSTFILYHTSHSTSARSFFQIQISSDWKRSQESTGLMVCKLSFGQWNCLFSPKAIYIELYTWRGLKWSIFGWKEAWGAQPKKKLCYHPYQSGSTSRGLRCVYVMLHIGLHI